MHVALAAAVRQRSAGFRGDPAVGHGRKYLVVHIDQRRGVFREIARVGDHQRDGLADIGHFVLGEHERRDVRRQLRATELQRQAFVRQ